jgi:hypothetical protein
VHYHDRVRLVAKEPGANPGRFRHCEGRTTHLIATSSQILVTGHPKARGENPK